MTETKYTCDHDWITIDGENLAIVGITEHAQGELGDVVYVELPEGGRKLNKGDEAAVVESVKAASDIKAPVSGTVVEVNRKLINSPELINQDPQGDGWFFKLQILNKSELDDLLNEHEYRKLIEKLR